MEHTSSPHESVSVAKEKKPRKRHEAKGKRERRVERIRKHQESIRTVQALQTDFANLEIAPRPLDAAAIDQLCRETHDLNVGKRRKLT